MKAKKTNPEHNHKLSVDTYEVVNGNLVCQCYTPGLTGEEAYIEKTVSIEVLKAIVCDGEFVLTTPTNDPEHIEPVPFGLWVEENNHSREMLDILSDIINKREGRTTLADMPDNPFKQVLSQVTNMKALPAEKVTRIVHQLRKQRRA